MQTEHRPPLTSILFHKGKDSTADPSRIEPRNIVAPDVRRGFCPATSSPRWLRLPVSGAVLQIRGSWEEEERLYGRSIHYSVVLSTRTLLCSSALPLGERVG